MLCIGHVSFAPNNGPHRIDVFNEAANLCIIDDNFRPGSVSLTVFPSQIKMDGNCVSFSPLKSGRYKIVYMARELCRRDMCKNLLRSDRRQRNCNKAKFPSNLNCRQNLLVKWAPGIDVGDNPCNYCHLYFLISHKHRITSWMVQSCSADSFATWHFIIAFEFEI